MMNDDINRIDRQQGSTLIVSLMLLIVLTLLGVTSMQSTILEERMAGSQRDREIAFQAAETALLDAEAFIEELLHTEDFNSNSNGFYSDGAPANLLNNDAFDISSSCGNNCNAAIFPLSSVFEQIDGVAEQPQMIIEHYTVNESENPTSLNLGRDQSISDGNTVNIFRITVRSVGGTTESPVYLQSYYGRVI